MILVIPKFESKFLKNIDHMQVINEFSLFAQVGIYSFFQHFFKTCAPKIDSNFEPAIASLKKLRHSCYAIIFSLGISDLASLITWIIIGLHTMTHAKIFPNLLIRHSLCVLVVGWGSLTVHIGLLSVNQFVAICKSDKHSLLFSRTRMYFIFTRCWVYAIFVHAFPTFLPPNMNYYLDGYTAKWDNPVITSYYFAEDITWCSSMFLLVFACYAAIIIRYRRSRQQFSILPASTIAARVRQFRLALQCMIKCFAFFFYDLLYYIISYLTIIFG